MNPTRFPSVQREPGEPADALASEGFRRVSQALSAAGHPNAPIWLDGAARTAAQAADALGVSVGQIAKSIVFRRESDARAVLVVTSGDRRVDEAKVAALVGALGRADASFVKASTGFAIGGVAPLGHLGEPVIVIDRLLARFDTVWAAAGHPRGVFAARPDELVALTGAAMCDVTVEPAASP
jgi:prolyl-tRNA editing enzyme YbaK/EbsC (Cys-tRNA(Pro) deacylase)